MTESLHALSGAYVVDALDDDERELFEQHLPGCRDCQAEVASLREAAALMADDAALTPPPSLRGSVLSGIKNVRPLPPETPDPAETTESPATPVTAEASNVVPLRQRRRFRLGALAAAAAVLAILGFGAVVQPWQDDSPPVAQLSPEDQVLAASDAKHFEVKFDDGSKATVVRSVSKGKAVIVTDDMAAPPSGKVFELWLQDESGRMSPAGLMSTAGDNKLLLKGDAATATGVGITVEPKGGSEQPTTAPIALIDMTKAGA